MTGAVVVRDQVHPGLDDNAPVTVRAHGVLDGGDDFCIRTRPSESMSGPDRKRSHRPSAAALTPAFTSLVSFVT